MSCRSLLPVERFSSAPLSHPPPLSLRAPSPRTRSRSGCPRLLPPPTSAPWRWTRCSARPSPISRISRTLQCLAVQAGHRARGDLPAAIWKCRSPRPRSSRPSSRNSRSSPPDTCTGRGASGRGVQRPADGPVQAEGRGRAGREAPDGDVSRPPAAGPAHAEIRANGDDAGRPRRGEAADARHRRLAVPRQGAGRQPDADGLHRGLYRAADRRRSTARTTRCRPTRTPSSTR